MTPGTAHWSACISSSNISSAHFTCFHHTFNGPLSGITRVSRYQKGKTNLDFNGARDSEWQWHQLGHMQVCTSLPTDNHASTPPLSFFTGRMPFLLPNQQRQSTEGIVLWLRNSVWSFATSTVCKVFAFILAVFSSCRICAYSVTATDSLRYTDHLPKLVAVTTATAL